MSGDRPEPVAVFHGNTRLHTGSPPRTWPGAAARVIRPENMSAGITAGLIVGAFSTVYRLGMCSRGASGEDEISVCFQLAARRLMPKRTQHDLHALAADEPKGWNKIGVACHDCNSSYGVSQSQAGLIQSDTDIYALLPDIEVEIVIVQFTLRFDQLAC